MSTNVLRIDDVSRKCGISKSMIWAKLNPKNRRHDADFPQPFTLGDKAIGWLESEIDTWIEHRAAQRGTPNSHATLCQAKKDKPDHAQRQTNPH